MSSQSSRCITAVVVARDAEATIGACVRALAFCNRIIVGENGSQDRTAEVASAAGAEVQTLGWEGYGLTKNRLLSQVTDGWVLSIDADEIVSPDLAHEIQAVTSRTDAADGYWLPRRNYFLGRPMAHCGWNPDLQLRLLRAGAGHFEERAVHEALRVQGRTAALRGPLEHYTYRSLDDYLQRMNLYTTLAAKERQDRGQRFLSLRLVLDPIWTMLKMLVFKSGWKDGFSGFVLCTLSSLNTLVKHAKLWELQASSRAGCRE